MGVRTFKPLLTLAELGPKNIRQRVIDENVTMPQATPWCIVA
jgi:hypothetical protein